MFNNIEDAIKCRADKEFELYRNFSRNEENINV